MIILLLAILTAIFFIVPAKLRWGEFAGKELVFHLLGGIAGFTAAIMLIIWAFLPIVVDNILADYEAMKITLSDARLHHEISALERVAIIESVIKNNQIIQRHRNLHSNFWIGVFYSKRIAGLDYILLSPTPPQT